MFPTFSYVCNASSTFLDIDRILNFQGIGINIDMTVHNAMISEFSCYYEKSISENLGVQHTVPDLPSKGSKLVAGPF